MSFRVGIWTEYVPNLWYEFLWIYFYLQYNSNCIHLKSSVTVSLENVLLDVKELGKGKDLVRKECSLHDHAVLKGFLQSSDTQLDKLQKDAKTAEVPFLSVTKHFLNTKPDYLNLKLNPFIGGFQQCGALLWGEF